MDLLRGYGGSSSDEDNPAKRGEEESRNFVPRIQKPMIDAAPPVFNIPTKAIAVIDPLSSSAGPIGKLQHNKAAGQMIMYNPKAEAFLSPTFGPEHPYKKKVQIPVGAVQTAAGIVERASVENWSFQEQYHTFQQYGYTTDICGTVVGNIEKFDEVESQPIRERKRKSKGKTHLFVPDDLGCEESSGIWAPQEDSSKVIPDFEAGTMTEEQAAHREETLATKSKKQREYNMEEDHDRRDERKMGHLLPPRHNRDTTPSETKSVFHGKSEKDYAGRSWVKPPSGHRAGTGDHNTFPPKKCIHKFSGHTKGVQAIEFFPSYGHLLLSCSMDGKIKIWDVLRDRLVRRTYSGHNAAVRNIQFNNDGTTFLSAGYDRFIRLWDTETGECLKTFTNRKMPYTVQFYPEDNNVFLAGCSDNKVIQWDVKSGESVQEYNHHLGPVNAVLFVDDNQRFVSTSDDKKVLIWEYGIPVPIKYISEPHMHSMPAVALHPSKGNWVGQSLDNQILTWGARDKFRQNRKKVFKGHVNAGYACQMHFSPNGKFLASGDGEGKLFVWDWGSTKIYRKLAAHSDGPCIDVKWHPTEPSWVATAGWDGLIKLWD